MACKAIGARTLSRRLNPDSGPYVGSLVLTGMEAQETWDLRFSFTLIDDGGDDCTAELYFEQNRDGAGWVPMNIAVGDYSVSIGVPGTNYDKAFKPFLPGSYQFRVRVEYVDGPWYSSIGTAVVTTATPDSAPRGDVTSRSPASIVGGVAVAGSVSSLSATSAVGSASAESTADSAAPTGTVGR